MPTRFTRNTKTNRKPRSRLQLELTLQNAASSAGLPAREQFKRWARAPLLQNASVTLRLVGRKEARVLNHTYRHRDYPTNVLTFSYTDLQPVGLDILSTGVMGGDKLSGDIVLCLPVIRAEARRQGKTLEAHLAHLTVHGMLHLQGFDHEADEDAELMEGIESEIVSKLGYPDPYAQVTH